MITEVVEHDKLLERAHEIADIVNSNAPLAVRGTRLAIHKTLDLPLHEAEILAETFRERVIRTEDALEGPRAFVEKRHPIGSADDGVADFETILLDFDARQHVATITLNRPERLNSFNRTMCEEMARCLAHRQGRRAVTRWCCAPPATARSAPAWTSRAPTDNPTTCGTTRIPANCSAPSGRRCGSRWSARCRECAPRERSTSSTRPTW